MNGALTDPKEAKCSFSDSGGLFGGVDRQRARHLPSVPKL